jgi:hypothetical protein
MEAHSLKGSVTSDMLWDSLLLPCRQPDRSFNPTEKKKKKFFKLIGCIKCRSLFARNNMKCSFFVSIDDFLN